MDTASFLKQVLENSTQLSTWGLAVFGGTVVAILGTSYRRPHSLYWRLPFLLFIPGWFCLGWSMHLGNAIAGRYLAATAPGNESRLDTIAGLINLDYSNQQTWLLWSLATFAVWLALYLLHWIFVEIPTKEAK
jgi:hypothetical protein